ncbi:PVC-type heme-binding CxxCH protein [Rubinisphaera sp.]|uniref:PVC-type heme-binding CxxCH protein n=1 Tax=Rubinisphaera sp. TaxID=2024857 RepID=UPI000C0D9894|nr:PVC-type heme-binding CxxCH protein [Rubinisphaera sp.]MBV09692.1 dehydrogenase [Rubinisphaera sp.]HCS52081.1 dehydrogenase [Planctomycetaceae bacterium]|tara:strand:- start:2159 stop:5329 length:3171 start_codon:yes stop_codon:yes gene_type:complete
MMITRITVLASLLIVLFINSLAEAQRLEIPRRHEKPPGPALSAEEAVKKMVVPEGFSVEIVAKEPDVVNPIGMAIDEKGRFWITESFEYPRKSPGPGKDRIKVLEDTDGDGQVDKTTIFAEGLNIPSGIAVGHGGVWVANAPDLLFMQDTDGDLKADKIEKVVTGFGRTDTHELPNSLTWGTDGWLYGLNGVFNYCDVVYTPENPNFREGQPGWKFTCALFRVHPRTREFQIFAEGTSNPWGIAINEDGEFFLSACVIDHLWHIAETAYYIRQGGPYPPHTWPMRSIVNHKHQKAAFCGITWFDSEAYPEMYRKVLYMGNIHGGCINNDLVEQDGATYKGRPHPGFPAPAGAFEHETVRKIGEGKDAKLADFLTANDAWFMPVVQKTGPDGCLYILDWYDRYHCYQDANADPEGIERSKGRLYRVVYKGHEHKKFPDLGAKSDQQLIDLLDDSNIFIRETAQRLLQERNDVETSKQLIEIVLNAEGTLSRKQRTALFALSGFDLHKDYDDNRAETVIRKLGQHEDPFARMQGLRICQQLIERSKTSGPHDLLINEEAMAGLEDESAQVRRQAIILTTRLHEQYLPYVNFVEPLVKSMSLSGNDQMAMHLLWNACRAFENRLPAQQGAILTAIANSPEALKTPGIMPLVDGLANLTVGNHNYKQIAATLQQLELNHSPSAELARKLISSLSEKVQTGEISGDRYNQLKTELSPVLARLNNEASIINETTVLSALLGNEQAMQQVQKNYSDPNANKNIRLAAFKTLIAAKAPHLISSLSDTISGTSAPKEFRIAIIETLGSISDPELSDYLLDNYPNWEPDVKPRVIEVLTQRDHWSLDLLKRIQAEKIAKGDVNLNQLKRVASFKNEELQTLVTKVYGQIRTEQRTDRQQVINQQRDFLHGSPGDPHQGIAVFKKVCAQCHKMYGEGAEVGPDITRNGRNNWEQLLQNVFDPSAVIGPAYQARTLVTIEGRVLTGLPIEESEERIVLKIQGGKQETIPRDQIEFYKVSETSMMPEDLEKQLTPQQLADLFAYLALDRPPSDPQAQVLSGAPKQQVRD